MSGLFLRGGLLFIFLFLQGALERFMQPDLPDL